MKEDIETLATFVFQPRTKGLLLLSSTRFGRLTISRCIEEAPSHTNHSAASRFAGQADQESHESTTDRAHPAAGGKTFSPVAYEKR